MNRTATSPGERRPWSLLSLTGMLLLALAFVAATFFLLVKNARHEQGWVHLATEIQVSSQQLSKSAGEAAGGNLDAFSELHAAHQRITSAITTLGQGSRDSDIPAVSGNTREEYAQLAMSWRRMNANSERILEQEDLMRSLAQANDTFSAAIPGIRERADEAVQALAESSAPVRQVAAASRQPALAERMLRRVSEILRGGSNAVSAARALSGEMRSFEEILAALRNGSDSLGIRPVQNAQALAALNRMRNDYNLVRQPLQTILDSSTTLFEVRGAADEIFLDSRVVFTKAGLLAESIVQLPHTRPWPSISTGVAGLIVMFVLVALLVRSVIFAERKRAAVATDRDRQNQLAIKRLLDELGSLANGDLTVQTTVNEEITREIATAVNYAIQRLREIVVGINQTAQAVGDSAELTRASSSQLAEAAEQQALQMDAATEDIRNMATAFDSVARRSQSSSEVAQKSVGIASNGSDKVNQTIKGMDLIREQIQETSKRIKRLGESTQEIGDIVGLINGIAEQTNVLALNAAIQAASAGGAGKGFAMVADEVQELAESATQATRRIESLVHKIQADTSEAVHSMESTTAEVVRGANLAEDAGAALQKIEAVSNDLSDLVQKIAEEAQSQSATATRISELMHGVRDVSVENSSGSKKTAETIDKLAGQVLKLSESVSDFKLPKRVTAADD